MSTFTITYEAKCKHCHFAQYFYKGKLKRTKCMFGQEHKHFPTGWISSEIKEANAPQIRMNDKACGNFKLFG